MLLALGYEVLEVLQNSFYFYLFLSVHQALVHALCPAKKASALMWQTTLPVGEVCNSFLEQRSRAEAACYVEVHVVFSHELLGSPEKILNST